MTHTALSTDSSSSSCTSARSSTLSFASVSVAATADVGSTGCDGSAASSGAAGVCAGTVCVRLCTGAAPLLLPVTADTTIESVCLSATRHCGISPLVASCFALFDEEPPPPSPAPPPHPLSPSLPLPPPPTALPEAAEPVSLKNNNNNNNDRKCHASQRTCSGPETDTALTSTGACGDVVSGGGGGGVTVAGNDRDLSVAALAQVDATSADKPAGKSLLRTLSLRRSAVNKRVTNTSSSKNNNSDGRCNLTPAAHSCTAPAAPSAVSSSPLLLLLSAASLSQPVFVGWPAATAAGKRQDSHQQRQRQHHLAMSPLLTARAGRFVPGALRPADGGGGGGGGESVGFAGGGGGGSPGQSPKHGHYRCYTLLLRYWPREPAHLLRLDPAAFDYWFHQVRSAFLLGDGRSGGRGGSAWSRCCVSEEDSLGLAVTDMLRVTLERRCTCARVLADWLHYVPRRPSRLRRPFLLASLRTHLERLTSSQCNSRQPCIDVNYVKLQYLLKALSLCRERCEERYWVQMVCGDGATGAGPIVLAVDPFHETTPGVRCIRPGQPDHCVCDISDLCYISNLGQCKIELARRCGVPLYLTFSSEMAMQSCVSLLDGWYRLLLKWSFCLNKQLQSPQQLRLRQLRSHGPISSQMAHGKLLARSGSEPGHYLIRQHRQLYRRFIVDLCTCDSAEPVQYDISELPSGMFQWTDSTQYSDTQYESIVAVLIDKNNNNSNNNCSADRAFIQCVFPSEQDEIPMGLFDDANNNTSAAADGDLAVTGGGGGGGGGGGCRRMFDQWQQQCFNITAAAAGLSSWYTQRSVAAAAASSSSSSSHSQPICVLPSALKLVTGRDSEWHGRYCEVQRAQWHRGGSLRQPPLDVAVKRLKHHLAERYLQCYTNSVSECLTWRCESLLTVHGVCLMQSVSLVMEWLPLGALSHYLASHRSQLQLVDLVEAGALLAKALWYLSEQRLTHGQIRCHNVLVAEHTDCRLRVKLADPGLRLVTETDIHWVPVEYFDKLSSSCWSSAADVWAYGTTLWQIFTYGATPLHGENLATAKQLYQIGARLPPPADCPPGVYRLMCECWCREVYNRKAPQAIMRDINQILYDVFNARQSHTYTDLVTSTEQNQSPPSAATATTSDLATQCESVCVSVNELTFSAATPVSHCSWDTDSISSSGVTTATQCQLSHCDLTDSALPPLSQLHLTRIDSPPTQPTSSPPPLSANSTVHPLANQLVRIGKHQMLLPSTDDSAAAAAAAASCLAEQHSRDQLPRVLQLQQSQLRLSEMLGSGFYGEVYKAVLTHSDGGCETVAVKRLKQRTMTQAALDDITREFQILQELRHPHVVSLRGVIAAPQLVLVLEYLCHGSLLACLQSDNGQLGSHQLLQFAADIAQGMEYLGQKNIIHRDLAARNVLVTADYRLKISDFGLAQAASPLTTYYYMKTNRELPFRWYAPESMRYGKFSAKSDVWSYAITLYEIFSLGANPQIPNCDDRQLLETLDRGVRLCCPPRCPVGIYITLMWPCWNETPQLRPSFTELIDSIDQLQQEY